MSSTAGREASYCPSKTSSHTGWRANRLDCTPIFGTTSKGSPDPTVGLEELAAVCRAVSVPVVAIGGITLDDIDRVARAGARAAAVIAAVATAPDPVAAGRQIASAFRAARPGAAGA